MRSRVLFPCRLTLLGVVLVACAFTSVAHGDALSDRRLAAFQEQEAKLRVEYQSTLTRLIEDCQTRGRAEAAQEVRAAFTPATPSDLSVLSLPESARDPIPATAFGFEREWRTRLRTAREGYAQQLFMLARKAVNVNLPGYAMQLVHRVAALDPDHEQARGLLGYVRQGDLWVTPFEARMAQQNYVWDDRFGWLPQTHLERYADGQRLFERSWIPAAREAEIRRDFRKAWEVRTEHFLVKTNVSLEVGAEIARELEEYHAFFRQVFAGFFTNNSEIMNRFRAGRPTQSRPQKPYVVHYYASKDEYVATLKSKVPQIAVTNGLYWTGDRISHFYHDPKRTDWATLYHEATHQFFYEYLPTDRQIATERHFWIIEGIACYMESYKRTESGMTVGDPNFIRFVAARHRLIEDRYYRRLEEFDRMGMYAFQTDANLVRNYSQASGLAHFFMHYDGGRYRDALVTHLLQMYTKTPRNRRVVQELDTLTGVSFSELDRQYVKYMQQQQESLRAANAGP